MSYSCRNYNYNNGKCEKLKSECVPGRRGCVLEGRVTGVTKELEEKLQSLSTGSTLIEQKTA